MEVDLLLGVAPSKIWQSLNNSRSLVVINFDHSHTLIEPRLLRYHLSVLPFQRPEWVAAPFPQLQMSLSLWCLDQHPRLQLTLNLENHALWLTFECLSKCPYLNYLFLRELFPRNRILLLSLGPFDELQSWEKVLLMFPQVVLCLYQEKIVALWSSLDNEWELQKLNHSDDKSVERLDDEIPSLNHNCYT